jgi:hypothetical protein
MEVPKSGVHAVTEAGSRTRAKAFEDAEASLRLEGLDPMTDKRYLAIKAQLIAGAVSFDQAEEANKAQYGLRPATTFATLA